MSGGSFLRSLLDMDAGTEDESIEAEAAVEDEADEAEA